MGDTQRWLELSLKGTFAYIDKPMATFRRLEISASRGKDMNRMTRFAIKSIELRCYYANKYPKNVDESRFGRRIREMGMVALRRAVLANDANLVREVGAQLPTFGLSQMLLFFIARFAFARRLYSYNDCWFIQIRRKIRRWKFGIESSI